MLRWSNKVLLKNALEFVACNIFGIPSMLIYHFNNCKNLFKALEYSIKNDNVYLDFNHELFPIFLKDKAIGYSNLLIDKEKAIKLLEDIEEIMNTLEDTRSNLIVH